jgi:hypothetical protein
VVGNARQRCEVFFSLFKHSLIKITISVLQAADTISGIFQQFLQLPDFLKAKDSFP